MAATAPPEAPYGRVLGTGGAAIVASTFVRHLEATTGVHVVVLDAGPPGEHVVDTTTWGSR